MVKRITLTNNTKNEIEVVIEPEAEYINWAPGKILNIELTKTTDQYDDELSIDFAENLLIIYESRQCDMKIFIDEELKYYTTPGRTRI